MTQNILLAMFSFSLVMSISPGPVNMAIISSGITRGFTATLPFISGATIGFTVLLFIISTGLSQVFTLYPDLLTVLEVCGALFIMYIGYKIATSAGALSTEGATHKRLTFTEGVLVQWLNPKAWGACLSGVSMFALDTTALTVFVSMYFVVCYASLSFWGLLGQKATVFLNTNARLKVFTASMGGVLMLSALSLIVGNT